MRVCVGGVGGVGGSKWKKTKGAEGGAPGGESSSPRYAAYQRDGGGAHHEI